MSSQIVNSLRDESIFSLGGEYGLSYFIVNASWCISLFLVITFGFIWLLRARTSTTIVYVAIPTTDAAA